MPRYLAIASVHAKLIGLTINPVRLSPVDEYGPAQMEPLADP
ncbi:hypothetical protein [Rugosimonospora acidiphila]